MKIRKRGAKRRAIRKHSKESIRFGRCKNQTTLLRKFEKLMRPVIIQRDGGKCQVEGYRHHCNTPLVVDHRPFKRGCHQTFLDPRNLTTVCANANMLAEYDALLSYAIIDVVKEREGNDIEEKLTEVSRGVKKFFHDDCLSWVMACHDYFQNNKNGLPEIRNAEDVAA